MQHDVESRQTTATGTTREEGTEQKVRLRSDPDNPGHEEHSERAWLIRALTLLLVVQGAGMIVLGTLNVDELGSIVAVLREDYFYATLPVLGVLALLAALGFFTLRPGAWVIAILVQALSLLSSLIYYFDRRPQSFVLYSLMVYSIVMVLYLNYANVPSAFRAQPGTRRSLEQKDER
ncbi:MAG TPA: hypothetical protein VK879_01140 [Candidatus Sulfomarinibacteraceae bacterium]|nr:hypothetical protein [Candidatus Sulfomarinibacteraceae bacterium]